MESSISLGTEESINLLTSGAGKTSSDPARRCKFYNNLLTQIYQRKLEETDRKYEPEYSLKKKG